MIPRVVVLADLAPPPPFWKSGDQLVTVAALVVLLLAILAGAGVQASKRAPPGTPWRGAKLAAMSAGFFLLMLSVPLVALVCFMGLPLGDPFGLPAALAVILVLGAPFVAYAWLDRRHVARARKAEAVTRSRPAP